MNDLTPASPAPIHDAGQGGDEPVGSLAAHAATYLVERRRRGEISRGTAIRASYILRSLDESFGHRPLTQFGVRAVERWLEAHPEWRPGTRHTYLGQVRVFASWMRRRKLIARDALDDLVMPKKPRPKPRPMQDSEVAVLFASIPDSRARLVITLQESLGLRCIGVANLRVEDIDWTANNLTATEKYGKTRILPITEDVARALAAYLAEHPSTSGPLVRSKKQPWAGISPAYVSSLVSRWMRTAGVKSRAHDGKGAHGLRHTCLTRVARKSRDAFVVQRTAGWSDVSTAAVYVGEVDTAVLRHALERGTSDVVVDR